MICERIVYDHGKYDSVVGVQQARDFDKTLTEVGITHVYEEYEGEHVDKWSERIYHILTFLSSSMDSEDIKSVNTHNKIIPKPEESKSRK